MTAFQEPLEKGWLRTVLNDVREEVKGWSTSSDSQRNEESGPAQRGDQPKDGSTC